MGIVSYAQNFEDVMLWRALGKIEHGFYIDIGAQDPIIDSVSLAFHEHGWHGIHVEPTPHYAELLRQQRPGDKVIQAAVGKGPVKLPFFEIPDTGISTADPVIAQQHRERGFDVHEITVRCIALSAVFKTCAGSEIHWLKIDVEGFEKQVLSSWGKSVARPWIVVVESTLPLTQIETHESWESILIGYGYTPVYFDGLNRYYISDAHPELKNAFLPPPNVFDGFTLNGTASASFHHLIDARYKEKISEILAQNEQHKQSATSEIERLTLGLASLDKTHAEQEQKRAQREQEVAAQLLAIQQQAAQEKAEQAKSHSEQARAVQRQHAEREQTLAQQLQAGQQELRHMEQDWVQREKVHAEQTIQTRQELEALLHTQVQREQEVAAQALAIQQQAAQEMSEQARSHREQERALHCQHDEREQTLSQQLLAGQQEMRRLEKDQAQREQVLSEQASLSRQDLENLLHTLAQREQTFGQQLQTAQQELILLEKDRAQREKALDKEIAALQSEIQALHHAQKLHAQQHSFEISTKQDEHNHLIQASAAWQAELAAQIKAELQTSLRLRLTLAEIQQSLATTHASFTWRMTSPIRAAALILSPKKKQSTATTALLNAELSRETDYGTIMGMPSPPIATTLEGLLSYSAPLFIRAAYQMVLGREPDPEGLSYYLGRLRAGFPRLHILAQLRSSKEGRARPVNLPGLDMAIQRYIRGQYPLVGWLFRLLNGTEANHTTARKLRAIEQEIVLFSDESNHRFKQMKAALTGLHYLVVQQTQSVVAVHGGTHQTDAAAPTIAPINLTEPDGLKQLSASAREIYFQLKRAASTHADKAS